MRITDKLPQFTRSLYSVLDDAIREGARDTLIDAKNKAPLNITGQLRADTELKKLSALKWRVSFWKEYARFQEFGGDGKRVVRNYTTPDTGRGFLKTAGDTQAQKIVSIFKKHAGRARA